MKCGCIRQSILPTRLAVALRCILASRNWSGSECVHRRRSPTDERLRNLITAMGLLNVFQRVSQSPTNPHPAAAPRTFDVADLYRGPVSAQGDTADAGATPLDEKLRQAYFWIVNTAIISPHYDVEFNDAPPQSFVLGDTKSRLTLPSAQS